MWSLSGGTFLVYQQRVKVVAFNVKTNSIPSQTTEPKELSISISVLYYYSAALVK